MRPIRCCCVLLAVLLVSTSLFASWTRTADTKGNQIYCVAQSAGHLFAGTWGAGIYRSSDDGVTWFPANNGLAVSTIFGFGAAPGWVFACTESGGGVYRSLDNGASWTAMNTGRSDTSVYSLWIIGSDLYASVGSGGVGKRLLSVIVS
jgi:hypothetical protein